VIYFDLVTKIKILGQSGENVCLQNQLNNKLETNRFRNPGIKQGGYPGIRINLPE
jgi:hypothetical protein